MNCHACGTQLSGSARFCHKCGAAVGASHQQPPGAAWRIGLPWGIAGAALGALITVLAMRPGGGAQGGAGAAPFAGAAPGFGGGAATDISQMSPEEMARRLFDRVMRLAEENKTDSVAFFVPMALQTYEQLPALDNDAHYDIGLLQLAAGNVAAALAQADTLFKAVPGHLYGFILRARALEMRGDAPGAKQAYAGFLRNESAERARRRPEYDAHATTLDAFKGEAARATAGGR